MLLYYFTDIYPVGRALPHALQDPQVNIAGIRRTGLLLSTLGRFRRHHREP